MDGHQYDQNTFLDLNDKDFLGKLIIVAIFHEVFMGEESDQND